MTTDFVTATGSVHTGESPAPAAVPTLDPSKLDDVSGGIVDGTTPFPRPRPDGLPTLRPPGASPTVPLSPFYPAPAPSPDAT